MKPLIFCFWWNHGVNCKLIRLNPFIYLGRLCCKTIFMQQRQKWMKNILEMTCGSSKSTRSTLLKLQYVTNFSLYKPVPHIPYCLSNILSHPGISKKQGQDYEDKNMFNSSCGAGLAYISVVCKSVQASFTFSCVNKQFPFTPVRKNGTNLNWRHGCSVSKISASNTGVAQPLWTRICIEIPEPSLYTQPICHYEKHIASTE